MSDHEAFIDDVAALAKKSVGVYATLAKQLLAACETKPPADTEGPLHHAWMAWADQASDYVQLSYRWAHLVDECMGWSAGGAGVRERVVAKGTKIAVAPARAVPAANAGLHATAFLDGYNHAIGAAGVSAVHVAGGKLDPFGHVRVTIDYPDATVAGKYAGSVVDDQLNLIVDRVELEIP
jgi:hypothetical protein